MRPKRRPISQREARALRKRVEVLETAERTWRGITGIAAMTGTWICDEPNTTTPTLTAVRTAARLRFAVFVEVSEQFPDRLRFYALRRGQS